MNEAEVIRAATGLGWPGALVLAVAIIAVAYLIGKILD